MPRLRESEEQKRKKAMLAAVESGKSRAGLKTDYEVAERLGMDRSTFSRHKASGFETMSFGDVGRMARFLKISGGELCKAAGVSGEDVASMTELTETMQAAFQQLADTIREMKEERT